MHIKTTTRIKTSYLSEWLSSINRQTTSVARMWSKGNSTLLVGLQIGATTMENYIEVPQKTKNRTVLWPSNSTSGYLSEEIQNINSKRYMKHIYSSQDMKATQAHSNRQLDKVVHIYNEMLLSQKRNKILLL